MRLILIAAVVLAVTGFAGGWLSAPALQGEQQMASAAVPQPPRIDHPGAATIQAVGLLSSLQLWKSRPRPALAKAQPAVAAAEPAASKAPPAPQPSREDIAERFQRELTAVVEAESGPVLWLVEEGAPAQRRRIRAGERYRDGWRVARIEEQYVILQRRSERRRIPLFSGMPSGVAAKVHRPAVSLPSARPTIESVEASSRSRRLLARPKHE